LMMKTITKRTNDMMVTVDPLKKYKEAKANRLVEACGIIPLFYKDAIEMDTESPASEVYSKMVDLYGFGDYQSVDWGTVSPEGLYESAHDDPDLAPLLRLDHPDSEVVCYIYQYAIMAVRDKNETILSRMD